MIGYLIEQELRNVLPVELPVATLLTMVEVDPHDPALQNPTKFIGPVYLLPPPVSGGAVAPVAPGRLSCFMSRTSRMPTAGLFCVAALLALLNSRSDIAALKDRRAGNQTVGTCHDSGDDLNHGIVPSGRFLAGLQSSRPADLPLRNGKPLTARKIGAQQP
jgi:hypothetical protein